MEDRNDEGATLARGLGDSGTAIDLAGATLHRTPDYRLDSTTSPSSADDCPQDDATSRSKGVVGSSQGRRPCTVSGGSRREARTADIDWPIHRPGAWRFTQSSGGVPR